MNELTRRSMFGTLAAAPAVATGMAATTTPSIGAPNVGATSHPDAALLAIFREWQAAAAESDRCAAEMNAAEDRMVRPDLSPTLLVRNDDPPSLAAMAVKDGMRNSFYPARVVDHLRRRLANPTANRNPPLDDRAKEIVAANDAREAEIERAWRECGYTAAEAAWDVASRAEAPLRRAVGTLPARTMDGVRAKIAAALWCYGGVNGVHEAFEDHLNAGGVTAEALQISILRDLVRMGGEV